jgi:hypothetical protein
MRFVAHDVVGDVWVILEHSLRVVEVTHNRMVIVTYAVEQSLRDCAGVFALAATIRVEVGRPAHNGYLSLTLALSPRRSEVHTGVNGGRVGA